MIYARIHLNAEQISELYEKHIKPLNNPRFLNKYNKLPLHKNNLPWDWRGKDFPRVIALLEFEEYVKAHSICPKNAVYFNFTHDPEAYILKPEKSTYVNYSSEDANTDLHTLKLERDDYDFAMLNQTLEHVYDPITCLENVRKHMKKGGILYFNVPACNIPHSTPYHHYTGITPTGVAAIVTSAGFKVLKIGQWGNLRYINYIYSKHTWPDYLQLRRYHNEIQNPAIAWCFAEAI
ncbi:MAG: hypothetical protein S4CHLAM37_13380 [Chlamydiia bacterium]|nr:hypothetical protein [Chlamydiia bacterium]